MSLASRSPIDPPPLEILLDDRPVVALNKPCGLPTQARAGLVSLESQLKAHLKDVYHKPGNVYLGVPHRLDRPVSGVVVFARNSKAAHRLAVQFQSREVQKRYWGVVESPPEPADGTLRDWLRKIPGQARAEVVSPSAAESRECVLAYRTLARAGDRAVVEIELMTGRMHQIRLQFASRGWCLVGDFLYGAKTGMCAERSADARAEPIALHARSLTFQHPVRYDAVTVRAPVPPLWRSLGVPLSD
jgi:23S rRNA pseudouridine1911/1915/1917 synthase